MALTYIAAAVALAGSIFNAKKLRIGFGFWIISNGYWIVRNLFIGEYAQAILFVVNTAVAVYGFIKWKQPYRDLEKFYVREDQELVTWVYYNPDSASNGQYVINDIDFDLIIDAESTSFSVDEFFHYIGANCRQYFSDKGTRAFKTEDRDHRKKKAAYIGVNGDTMMGLITLANKREEIYG